MNQKRTAIAIAALWMVGLAGCGSGSGGQVNGDRTFNIGPITTRVAGTSQGLTTQGGSGAVVTGAAGGVVNSMVLADPNPSINETKILWASDADGDYEIMQMSRDGSGSSRLTTNSSDDRFPQYSPDGSKIVFASLRDGNWEIYTMNADGTNQVRLTNHNGTDWNPNWSPDGAKIVFERDSDIYSMNADGTVITQLTNTQDNTDPAWSPDGLKIAFVSARNDIYGDIYTMNASGSNETLLWAGDVVASPSYSPDGQKIAFLGSNISDETGFPDPMSVYTIRTNATSLDQITTNGANNSNPMWSIDSQTIFFASDRDGNNEIYAIASNGVGNATRLTTNTSPDSDPSGSPYFRSQVLIGPSGKLGATASGFLIGQAGPIVASLLTFTTQTPVNARVQAESMTNPNQPNLLFTAKSTDAITSLSFIHSFAEAPTVVIGPGAVSSATWALISYDAANGKVVLVVPFTATRSAGNPSPWRTEGNTLVVQGPVPGVWDSTGKNVAPNGANEVRLDRTTGKVISVK